MMASNPPEVVVVPDACATPHGSSVRIEYRMLALHQRVAVAHERQAVLGLQFVDVVPVLPLPGAEPPKLSGTRS